MRYHFGSPAEPDPTIFANTTPSSLIPQSPKQVDGEFDISLICRKNIWDMNLCSSVRDSTPLFGATASSKSQCTYFSIRSSRAILCTRKPLQRPLTGFENSTEQCLLIAGRPWIKKKGARSRTMAASVSTPRDMLFGGAVMKALTSRRQGSK